MALLDVRRVSVEPLDTADFSRFGSVIEAGVADDATLNRAPGHMAYMWIHQQLEYPKLPFIATCRYYFRGPRCEYLQKHPASTVVLIPLDAKPSVIWVALDRGGTPDLSGVQAVLLDGRRGIVLNPGVWIRYAYPILETADFAYISARKDPEEDIVRHDLERHDNIVLEWYVETPTGEGVGLSRGGAVTRLPAPGGRRLELGVGGRIVRAEPAGGRRGPDVG